MEKYFLFSNHKKKKIFFKTISLIYSGLIKKFFFPFSLLINDWYIMLVHMHTDVKAVVSRSWIAL